MNFAKEFEIYRSNVFPGMLHDLSKTFNVSIETLEAIGVGYYPKDNAWVFPERSATGDIIGMSCRSVTSSKKWFIKGSKRGLTYALNQDYHTGNEKYDAGRHNWTRVDERKDIKCPVCGKYDWCLVSADNPTDPAAVICPRTPRNAKKHIEGSGYLHILKSVGNVSKRCVIKESDAPVLIVEGFSDTATAIDLGFVGIGKPSAEGGNDMLKELPLAGRTVLILGDHDSGAGERGMNKTFLVLSKVVKDMKRSLPPAGAKDLRIWRTQFNIDKEGLVKYFETAGRSGGLEDVFKDDIPITIAERFLQQHKMHDGVITLRNLRGQWMEWKDGCYSDLDLTSLRGQLYRYLDGKQFAKEGPHGIEIFPYKAKRSNVGDIIDAANASCVVTGTPPCWLGDEVDEPNFNKLIVFNNGMLDVGEYVKGNIMLSPPTPKLLSYNAIPCSFDENAESNEWNDTISDIFQGDEMSIQLLREWMGYLLLPDMSFEKFMMFVGPPRSGKGTIIETVSAMLGDRNCASTSLKSLAGDFGHQKLLGKLAVFLPDVKAPKIQEAPYLIEKILQITGGDPVNVNRKFLAELPSVHLTCRFTLAVNEIPELPDYMSALLARLLALSFPKSYLGHEDIRLKARLKKRAREGKLVNFALRGLKSLYENKKFTVPAGMADVEHSFREINSPIWAFVHDCCDTGGFTECRMMYDAWKAWCTQNNVKSPGNKAMFSRRLKATIPTMTISRKCLNSLSGDTDGREYVYRGFCLKNWIKSLMG